jgi:predicted RNase H-like nuclease
MSRSRGDIMLNGVTLDAPCWPKVQLPGLAQLPKSRSSWALGIDGCRSGWFLFAIADDSVCFGVLPTFEHLARIIRRRDCAFVDIPIGLKHSGDPDRGCDSIARSVLGPRSSSVFNAPLRPVLQLTEYPSANRRNKELSGKGLSRQSFNIMPKIDEVDRALRSSAKLRATVAESHPEVCFWSLANEQPLAHPKKQAAGFVERMSLLSRRWPPAESLLGLAWLHTSGMGVARDDVLDAMVLALSAARGSAHWRTLPAKPANDPHGLPMRMRYADFTTA